MITTSHIRKDIKHRLIGLSINHFQPLERKEVTAMKEFLATGAMVAVLALFGTPSVGPECRTNCPSPVPAHASEGFVPHERVTTPSVRDTPVTNGLLPDFGSEAYL